MNTVRIPAPLTFHTPCLAVKVSRPDSTVRTQRSEQLTMQSPNVTARVESRAISSISYRGFLAKGKNSKS